ncbi:MAG: redoxin domain-containing protein [Candidatus Heimdallarchaeota archaeon]|nr:redoxin domain-containing protein [Candidatus Heimdallarchaeota archaeon]
MLNVEVLNLEVLSGETISDISSNNEGIVFFSVPIFTDVTSQIELKHLQEIYSEFKNINWEIIISTVDSQELVEKYISENNIQFPILIDQDLILSRFLNIMGENGTPLRRTVVIDKNHQVKRMFKQIIPKEHPREVLKWIELNDQEAITMLEKGMSIQ